MRTEARAESRSLRRAARGSVLNLFGSIIAGLATFVLTIIVTRGSSQAEAGVFFSATSLFLLASNLGRLGTNTGLVYFISRARARGQRALARMYMRIASVPVLAVAVVMALLLFLSADELGRLLSPGRAEEFALYMQVMAFFVPAAAVANLAVSGSQGLGTMKVYAVLDHMVRPLLQLLAVAGILLLTGHSGGISIAWSIAYLPLAVAGWWWWHRLAEPHGADDGRPREAWKAFWKFTSPRALASVSQVAMQRLDIILVGALAGLAQAAIYTAATRFLVLGQMAGRAISLSVQPLLGEALARRDLPDARRLYQVCTAWLVVGTWPFYLLLMGFGGPVLVVFGQGYSDGSSALLLLCAAMLFATACGMVDMVLNMAGKSLWNLVNVLIAFAVNLSLDLILIPRMGFMGAAIGWAAAITVANLLPLVQILFVPGLHPFGRGTLAAMGVSVVCFAALPYGTSLAFPRNGVATMVAIGVGALLYLAFLVKARDMLALKMLLGALRRRRRRNDEPPPVLSAEGGSKG